MHLLPSLKASLQASKTVPIWVDKTITCYPIICSTLYLKEKFYINYDPTRTSIISIKMKADIKASANSGITITVSNPAVKKEVIWLYWYLWEDNIPKTAEADITDIIIPGDNTITLEFWRGWLNIFTITAYITVTIEITYAGEEPETIAVPWYLSWLELLLEYKWIIILAIIIGAITAAAAYWWR